MSEALNSLNEDSFFNSEDTQTQSGWFKFTKVGDRVVGKVVDKSENETPGFAPQLIFTLELKDGSIMNVAVKKTQYFVSRSSQVRIGDLVGFTYVKELPPQKKGHKPTKQIEMRHQKVKDGEGFTAKDFEDKPAE